MKTRKDVVQLDTDEHEQTDTTVEMLSKMQPAFKTHGPVTTGNASGIDDGAAAVVLAAGDRMHALGLRRLARLVGHAHAGVEPAYLGIGPVPATSKVLLMTMCIGGGQGIAAISERVLTRSDQVISQPPATSTTWPVTNAASGDVR